MLEVEQRQAKPATMIEAAKHGMPPLVEATAQSCGDRQEEGQQRASGTSQPTRARDRSSRAFPRCPAPSRGVLGRPQGTSAARCSHRRVDTYGNGRAPHAGAVHGPAGDAASAGKRGWKRKHAFGRPGGGLGEGQPRAERADRHMHLVVLRVPLYSVRRAGGVTLEGAICDQFRFRR